MENTPSKNGWFVFKDRIEVTSSVVTQVDSVPKFNCSRRLFDRFEIVEVS